MPLSYARQIALPEIGPDGQAILANTRVAIVGLGGLGSPAAQWLALAGVGALRLIDGDRIDATNLHRQPLYRPADCGQHKVAVAAARLQEMAPGLKVETHAEPLGPSNAATLLANCDAVIDGTDRIPVRYTIEAACQAARIPWVFGAVRRFEGQMALFGPTDCWYRDLWPEAPLQEPPSCSAEGILGAVPGLVGTWQAMELVQWLLGLNRPRCLSVMDFRNLVVERIELGPDREGIEVGPDLDLQGWTGTVIDVREDGERQAAPASAAGVQAPWSIFQLQDWPEPLLFGCASGARSLLAARQARAKGLAAFSLRGGFAPKP